MENMEFRILRQKLQRTQKQMSELLGTSLKAIQSFEQGWRKVPLHIERQMLFLMSTRQGVPRNSRPCWDIRNCSSKTRGACPAWQFNVGDLCWFINGTICHGKAQGSWAKKMKLCRTCEVFDRVLKAGDLWQVGEDQYPPGAQRGRRKKLLNQPCP
jgi:DNA-binding XRE family transcriptional regulator